MITFQSSPTTGGGCDEIFNLEASAAPHVSIPTHHGGRVRHWRHRHPRPGAVVSIPTHHGGRVRPRSPRADNRPANGFNPHPPRGAGATADAIAETLGIPVSIPTHHGGRVRRRLVTDLPRPAIVSIPTHHGGRVRQLRAYANTSVSLLFQSPPTTGGGCDESGRGLASAMASFQSPPTTGGGCDESTCSRWTRTTRCFNPHPPRGAGATLLAREAGDD